MISKYDQRQSGHTLTLAIGDYVTVFIPRQDRAATDGRRLPARVIAKLHGSRYQLQTEYGVLKHHYGARHLEKVPNGILSTITDNPAVITLQAAAKTASRNPTGSTRAHCNCRTACNTQRCGCVKASRTCTIHCHPRGTGDRICCNKPSGVGEDGDEGATGIDQARDREDDSDVE